MADDPNTLDPAKLEAKRLEAFNVVPIAKGKRPPGPGRGHKVKMGTHDKSGRDSFGPGYGGPAKGASKTVGQVVDYHVSKPEFRAKLADKAVAADRMLVILTDVAENSEHDMAKIAAASAALDRIEGKPVQRVIAGTTETVEEIRTKDPQEAALAYQRAIQGR